MAECRIYPLNSREQYRFVVILAQYHGQWVCCQHKNRDTWELPGGHIEEQETPLDAAKRELWEETGASHFTVIPVFDYWADLGSGGSSGMVFFAVINELGSLSAKFEMKQIGLFNAIPDNQTYPVAHLKLMQHFLGNYFVSNAKEGEIYAD